MPLFSTNRGYIGRFNSLLTVLSADSCLQDEENVRKIVARLLGELLSEINKRG